MDMKTSLSLFSFWIGEGQSSFLGVSGGGTEDEKRKQEEGDDKQGIGYRSAGKELISRYHNDLLLSVSMRDTNTLNIPNGRLASKRRWYADGVSAKNPGLMTRTPNQPDDRLTKNDANTSANVFCDMRNTESYDVIREDYSSTDSLLSLSLRAGEGEDGENIMFTGTLNLAEEGNVDAESGQRKTKKERQTVSDSIQNFVLNHVALRDAYARPKVIWPAAMRTSASRSRSLSVNSFGNTPIRFYVTTGQDRWSTDDSLLSLSFRAGSSRSGIG